MNDLFIKSVMIDWNKVEKYSYLKDISALKSLLRLDFHNHITFFVGENGTGKSTLLEAIAVSYGFNSEGGTRNYRFSTFDSHSCLYQAMRLSKGLQPKWSYFFRAESFYNVASQAEEYRDGAKEIYYSQYGGKSLHEQSHGESFLALMKANFLSRGLYILDEPEAALSPQRQLSLLLEIYQSAKRGSQFIIATHSPILLGIPDAMILSFDDEYIHEIEYQETESYIITEMFINHKERFLDELLKK